MENLDLDSISLEDIAGDTELEEMDLSGYGEVNDTVDFPHVKVSTKQFKEVLKTAKTVCATAGRDVISKAVCLQAKGDKLVCYATDFDVYLEMELELLNSENVMPDAVVVPIDILIKLSKAVPVNTILFKDEEGNFKIRLYGGDIVLETFSVDIEKFKFMDSTVESSTIASTELYSVVKDFSSIVTNAVTPAERRIICEPDNAFAFYMWGIINSKSKFDNMDLKVKDISVLKSLLNGVDEPIQVLSTTEDVKTVRKVFVGSSFKYAFLISDSTVSDSLKNDISKVVTDSGVFVDFAQLFKLVDIASELPYSMGKVGLNYGDDGVVLSIKTKKSSDSIFTLNGSKIGDVVSLDSEVVVSAKLLRVFLRSFSNQSSVKLSLSANGLGISTDSYASAIYPENK